MDYLKYISTPAGTTEDDPKETSLTLSRGTLTGGWIYFPRGPAGKLHLTANIAEHQILPYNRGESYRLNNAVVPFHLYIHLKEPPFNVTLNTWNDSTSYAHALSICFYLTPRPFGKKAADRVKDLFANAKGYYKP